MRILVVEDDELTAAALKTLFSEQNYAVEVATDGHTAADLVDAFEYDLILSDVVLPGLDGVSLCRQVRSHNNHTPILLLTARDNGHDKAVGLDAGADDYVVKPFDPEELMARVRALLRRADQTTLPILEWEAVRLDPRACEVTYDGSLLQLTPKEYGLLELLMRHSKRVFSCGMVLEHLWAFEDAPGEDAVRTHIKGLRQKLKAAGAPSDLIETVYGIGYRLKPLAELSKSQAAPATELQQQTLTAIAEIWAKFQPRVSQQVALIEKAATTLDKGALDAQLREQARREAHTLAGGLGTFGLMKGSQVAREIEHLLQEDIQWTAKQIRQFQQEVTALRQEVDQAQQPSSSGTQNGQPTILFVDSDRTLLESFGAEAQQHQVHCLSATTIALAQEQLQSTPSLVLFDPAVAESEEESLAFLRSLAHHSPPIPVLIFTAKESFSGRIAAARLGGHAYLSKTLPMVQVWETVERALQSTGLVEAQIMIVDDDPQTLEAVVALLKPWGLAVTPLADPNRFWETLAAHPPDLLVLDVEMPKISGVDLCQVVRNDPQWEQLPIIFLTAHTEPETVNRVYVVGADDFVSKPIVGPELVVRILNRLERSRLQRHLDHNDAIAQTLHRDETLAAIVPLLNQIKEQRQPLCLVLLEVERLLQINEGFGYEVGNQVLRSLVQVLQQSLPPEGAISRSGGSQFAIGLGGLTAAEGEQWCQQLMVALQPTTCTAPDGTIISISCSVGLAQYPEDGLEVLKLRHVAESALTTARAMGCRQICLAHLSGISRDN